jgi:hypothetical protein
MAKKELLPKIDLSLIKKLVGDLEVTLLATDLINQETALNDWISEMSKASGLAASAAQEASLLVHDIYTLIRANQGLVSKKQGENMLEQLLGSYNKGDPTAN